MEIKEIECREATSVLNWIVTMSIIVIPIINIIMLIKWAFGNKVEASKANWAKAQLILIAIMIVITIIAAINSPQ